MVAPQMPFAVATTASTSNGGNQQLLVLATPPATISLEKGSHEEAELDGLLLFIYFQIMSAPLLMVKLIQRMYAISGNVTPWVISES
jgi:hypothetical protein